MAKQITVSFDNGGIFDGFASTFTLDNVTTYYFSFDRDYRVTLTADGAIDTQEYRNNGAWYTIDIITAVTVSEISGGGGDVTKDWVNDNFVKKSGDTMTGPLNFENSVTGKCTIRINNGNEESTPAQITLYKMGSTYSQIALYNTEQGATTDDYILINYSNIYKKQEASAWNIKARLQFNNPLYLHSTLYARGSDNTVNARITNTGLIMTYNGGRFACHKLAMDADPNYWTEYRYDGRTTSSNIGGEDSRYRIVGYNNFASSVEFYSSVRFKTENSTTGNYVFINKNGVVAYHGGDSQRVSYGNNGIFLYNSSGNQNIIISSGIWLYNNNGIALCQTDTNGAHIGINYNGITAYNYQGITFNVSLGNGYYYNDSQRFEVRGNYVNIRAMATTGMDITAPNGYIAISDSKGVMGRTSNTQNNTYIQNTTQNVYVQTSQTTASDSRRDELEAILDMFRIVYNILDGAGISGASQLAEYTSDIVLWIYDNQNGVLKPTITKIKNLIHN